MPAGFPCRCCMVDSLGSAWREIRLSTGRQAGPALHPDCTAAEGPWVSSQAGHDRIGSIIQQNTGSCTSLTLLAEFCLA